MGHIKDARAYLKNILLFSSLTDEELQHIGDKVVFKKAKKNDVIMHEEDTNEFMYVILAWKVKVVRITEDGKEIILAIHRSRESFGGLSIIDNKTAPAMVLAAEKSIVAIISRKDFYSLIYTQGKVLDTLLQILCSRLRDEERRRSDDKRP
jgi:CRP/FNR family transcriptional regulator